ncbi:isochorismatase family protein [Actinoallomurus sp. NBC_01490]|jgi:nicotinamidase-related amidase|uniref:isochorismatase family protein n=1 Tax=Actinoallomurus sp. NBC_01490 TaxID=2903557 RepID=UPI002E36819F|nr:isochorismatase family protein [Actinoallomurus sp. NBC_01490]
MSSRTPYAHSLDDPELRKLYREAGFSGRVGWGSRPAVLVIDMAKAWTDRDEQLGADVEPTLKAVVTLLGAAREHDVPIIFTTMAYDPAMIEAGPVVTAKTPHSKLMLRGSERTRLCPELGRRDDEPLVEKPRASAFFGTNVLSMLVGLGADTVIVVGVSTSGCVRSTCESAFNHNLHVIVPRDAVADRSTSAHAGALMDIDARFGDVTTVDDVLNHLSTTNA